MKKIIVFLLIVTLLAASLISCGDKTNDTGDTSNGSTVGNAEDGNVDNSSNNRSSIMDDFRNDVNDFGSRMIK